MILHGEAAQLIGFVDIDPMKLGLMKIQRSRTNAKLGPTIYFQIDPIISKKGFKKAAMAKKIKPRYGNKC